jgi:hypothetical protein
MSSYDSHVRSGIKIAEDRYVLPQWWTPDEQGLGTRNPPEGSVMVGITEHHLNERSKWCGGYVNFSNVAEAALYDAKFGTTSKHELVSIDPLTISPSLQCRHCSSHGFIENGEWRDA